MINLQNLAAKYSQAIPRYTSYPTAVELSSAITHKIWLDTLIEELSNKANSDISVYLHIPFCSHHCLFCACNTIHCAKKEDSLQYISALKAEIDLYRKVIPEDIHIKQIHWGGGTPNFLSPNEIEDLHNHLISTFPLSAANHELSFEADPRTLSEEHLAVLDMLHYNRLSLGIQDLDLNVQKAIHRKCLLKDLATLCQKIDNLSFTSLNFDLIYGLPFQTSASFEQTIEKVACLKPDRIALYAYAHVPWVAATQQELANYPLPFPEERIAIFSQAVSDLTAHGYRYIGLDHFALPTDSLSLALDTGNLNRNFMGYTSCPTTTVIALGVSAISNIEGMMVQNEKNLDAYYLSIAKSQIPIAKGLLRSNEDQIRSYLIQSLLCQGKIDIKIVEERFSIKFDSMFNESLKKLNSLIEDGLINLSPQTVELTELGRIFARNAASAFDIYLARKNAQKVFSKAV